ncbi:MAG: response regulator, partial [Planctomycetota bacterium]
MTQRDDSKQSGLLAWRRELGVRIVAILLVVTGLAAVIEGIVDWRSTETSMREDLETRGGGLARSVARYLREMLVPPYPTTDIEDFIDDLMAKDGPVFVAVVRGDGVAIATSPRGVDPTHEDDQVLVIHEAVVPPGSKLALAHVHLGMSLAKMREKLRDRIERLLLRSAISALLVGLAIWLVLRRVVVQPLRHLDQEAQRLASGDLATPLHDYGQTEIGRLGRTLDEMRTNLAQSHAAIADQNKRLVELDRLKSQFLANMSHEMRTPLTSILGESEMLGEVLAMHEEGAVATRAIHRNGVRLLELVDRMLDLAKVESGNLLVSKQPCRPAEAIVQACERFEAEAHRKGLRLLVDVTGLQGVAVLTDPSRLQQMVASIVGNAVKFTAAGSVTVTGSLQTAAKRQTLSIVVADTGIGMPKAFLAGGIAAFKQQDESMTRRHEGLGLGLYVTQQIAKSLNGELTVTSEPGRGTTAEIRIKVEPWFQSPEPAAGAPAAKPKARVLVVDDARDNQHLLKAMLQKLGHTVELADNGRVGVDTVKAARPGAQFDLVLMDLQMPELDGFGAIQELRGLGYTMPIVALTAHALADDRERCFLAGATAYETKPITRQRLADVV